MALMMGALYEALRSANVPEDTARRAAEEAAGVDTRTAKLESDVATLKWMVASVIALQIMIFAGLMWLLWEGSSTIP
ncbi:hypothetical protein KXS07_36730 [Inquilinus limosus]|uniref:hypothetical protein n=1 Tax=Inquilinus limosus TaxID=171674 RepID=UPI0005593F0C|nr:hypothetical protein [Inquilinus limosus]